MFEHAVRLDPNFVDAWCGIAHTCQRELIAGFTDDPEGAKKTYLDAARRAVALDDGNADAHHFLSFAVLFNGRPAEAVTESERAVDLNPINPLSHGGLGATLLLSGRPAEALKFMKTGMNLNPRHPRIHIRGAQLARAHLDAHQYEEAADQARQVVRRGRVYLDEHLMLASALGHLGRCEEANAVLDDLEEYRGIRIGEITLCPWWRLYHDPGPNAHLFEGLRKAGVPD